MNLIESIINEEIDKLFEVSYGYHSGDLGKSSSDGLYGLGASRHTGHFGSGTYFFGNEKSANEYENRPGHERPQHKVDFDKYHLFRPSTPKEGMILHNFLERLNSFFVRYPKDAPLDSDEYFSKLKYLTSIKNKYNWGSNEKISKGDFNHFIKIAKSLENSKWYNTIDDIVNRCLSNSWSRNDILDEIIQHLSHNNILNKLSAFNNFTDEWTPFLTKEFNVSPDKIKDIIYSCRDYYLSHDIDRDRKEMFGGKYTPELRSNIDSCSTFFMKELGYNGIDVRGYDNLDNGMYGSVIYDLDNQVSQEEQDAKERERIEREREEELERKNKEISDKINFWLNKKEEEN